jgi:tRNA (guanine-N7-)-methyltransferase
VNIRERRWVNPYVDKIASIPDLLIGSEQAGLDDAMLSKALERIQSFDKRFYEIGSGSGSHLIERALKDPSSLYLGVELRYKRAFKTAEKAIKAGASNVLVVRGDANKLTEALPKESFDGIYINFPDPWAKKRWNKNRMVSSINVIRFYQLLKQEGFLALKTDHGEYFESAKIAIDNSELYSVTELTRDLYMSEYNAFNVTTEFENLFKSKGLSPHYLRAVKKFPTNIDKSVTI